MPADRQPAPSPAPTDTAAGGYVDLYLLPVPEAKMDAYREQAATFGAIVVEHGGLRYREVAGDDLGASLAVEAGTVLTAAIAEFASRAHRDEVMARVMADPRVEALMQGGSPADMDRMRHGGFATFVSA
jgi:uncharacterized protein YbaA (DUF1428 family)